MSAATNQIIRERESDVLRKKVIADTTSAANRFLDAEAKEGSAAEDFSHEEAAARTMLDKAHKADKDREEAIKADERRFQNDDKLDGILDRLSGNATITEKVLHAPEAIAHTASNILEKIKEAAEAVKEKVQRVASSDKLEHVKNDSLSKSAEAKKELTEKTENALDKANDLAADAKAKASDALENAKETAAAAWDKTKDAAESAKDKTTELAHDAANAVTSTASAAWNKTTAAAEAVKEKISAATTGAKNDSANLEKQASETDWFNEGGNCQYHRATASISPAANNAL